MNRRAVPFSEGDCDPSRWRFADVELDEGAFELRVRGEQVALEPKPLEFLMCLLRHAGEVVTKDELLEALWAGRVVTESVLTSCVAKLRSALGDEDHRLVRTVHGYGYRLVAEVTRDRVSGPRHLQPLKLEAGDSPPLRPQWRLVSAFSESRGETWLIQQRKGDDRRVLKFAFDARDLARLKREITVHRLLLASLGPRDDFVRLLDWNLEQRPYFLEFEHCPNGSLLEWTTAQGGLHTIALPIRLAIVVRCARALSAAHSTGVLHKDIKPANLLVDQVVDGMPQVRLADFGSGGIFDDRQLGALNITRLGFTQQGQDVETSGTWTYLAPEVVAGQLPTVRSDIFSLGVLLYQLLVGDLQRPLAPGWERELSDELLRDDVQACCDIDPNARISDAAELARRLSCLDDRRLDLARTRAEAQRALRLEQDLARGRIRRRWLSSLAAVATIAFAVTLHFYLQAGQARDESRRQEAAARNVNEFLVRDLIAAADPMDSASPAATAGSQRAPGQVPVRELLDRASLAAGQRFAGQPGLEVAVRMSLGEAYMGLSAYVQAAQQFEAAHQLLEASGTTDAFQDAKALLGAARAMRESDDLEGAEDRLDRALAIARGVVTQEDPGRAQRLLLSIRMLRAWLMYKRGAYEDAIDILQTDRPLMASSFGELSEESGTAYLYLANSQLLAGRPADAEASARRAIEVRGQLGTDAQPRMIEAHSTLADILRMAGKRSEAEAENRTALGLCRQLLGANHAQTLVAQGTLATLLQDAGKVDEAISLFEDAVRRSALAQGESNYETVTLINNLGLAYADAGRTAEAIDALDRSLRSGRATLGEDHPDVVIREHNLADVLADAGRWDEALALEQRALRRAVLLMGPQHTTVAMIKRTMGRIQAHRGELVEARASLIDARSILVAELGPEHAQVQKVERLLSALGDAPAHNRPMNPPGASPVVPSFRARRQH